MYFVLGSCASLGVVSVAARSFLNKADRFISRSEFVLNIFGLITSSLHLVFGVSLP